MLARIQQSIALALLLACLSSIAYGWATSSVWLAVIGPIAIPLVYAAVMAAEFALLWLISREDKSGRAHLSDLFKAWLDEIFTSPRIFCWQQPFRSSSVPDSLYRQSDGQCGVVLIHGFFCNRGVWNATLQRLGALNIPCVSVNLEPVFGSIDDYLPIIEDAVRRTTAATGKRPVIVAHSMGGLAVRAWLRAFKANDRVKRIITVATPHRGTYLARFAIGINTRQMRIGSPWLLALAAYENPAAMSRFTCFYGNCDNIVIPIANATLRHADNIHLGRRGHVSMANHDLVFAEVVRWVASDEPNPTRIAGTPTTFSAEAQPGMTR